ncbi:hypothetical protein QTH97_07705 [Variovorax sp. J22R24]|uniref:hypothetical protein n=1 Tax=Variovorax gracilis TaxID=3053502 RepID=UPI002578B252|nr:hypothetical protein [Variovorax sp. J22R24]MDM0104813.1 hypothetical protein [Variovorax sp. J22R24]
MINSSYSRESSERQDVPSSEVYGWPLRFAAHQFDAFCYSTYGCKVKYGNYRRIGDPEDQLKLSSTSIGSAYPNNLSASYGPIRNFPQPASATWRSKDGTPLHAEIDMAQIFKEQVILHNLNLVAQYVNRLSDAPILQLQTLPEDRDLYRVHRSDQHAFFYGTRGYDADGLRDRVNQLGSSVQCRVVEVRECISKDPMSPELERQLERRAAAPSLDATAIESVAPFAPPRSDLDRMIDQLYAASLSGNDADWQQAMQTTSQQFMRSPQGQAWQQEVDQYGLALQAQQAELEAQQLRQQALQRHREAPAHQPAMRM